MPATTNKDFNELIRQVATLTEAQKNTTSAMSELRLEFREFKQYYVTKEELANAMASVETRIKDLEDEAKEQKERIKFYVRFAVTTVISTLVIVIISYYAAKHGITIG